MQSWAEDTGGFRGSWDLSHEGLGNVWDFQLGYKHQGNTEVGNTIQWRLSDVRTCVLLRFDRDWLAADAWTQLTHWAPGLGSPNRLKETDMTRLCHVNSCHRLPISARWVSVGVNIQDCQVHACSCCFRVLKIFPFMTDDSGIFPLRSVCHTCCDSHQQLSSWRVCYKMRSQISSLMGSTWIHIDPTEILRIEKKQEKHSSWMFQYLSNI